MFLGYIITHLHAERNKIFILLRSFSIWMQNVIFRLYPALLRPLTLFAEIQCYNHYISPYHAVGDIYV